MRELTRPEGAPRVEEKRTIVALPGQFIGASAQASRSTTSGATVLDVRGHRSTGEFTAVGAGQAQVDGSHVEVRAPVRLIAGKPIPGTRYKLLRWLGEGG
ncbi:MAG TPA: hypothetical protein VIK91_19540, partial [Nannocystis sp.]